MDTYQGICKYCGEQQPIMAEDQTDADEQVSNKCDCGGAAKEQIKAKLMSRIIYIAKGDYDPTFTELSEPMIKILKTAGNDILEGMYGQIEFVAVDSKIKIWTDGEKYKVSRTGTRKEVAEA